MCDQSKGLDLSKCPYLDQPAKDIEHRFYVDGWVAGVQALDLPKTERAEEAPIAGHGINIPWGAEDLSSYPSIKATIDAFISGQPTDLAVRARTLLGNGFFGLSWDDIEQDVLKQLREP